MNLAKFLGGPFFTEHLRWLLLEFQVFLLIKYFSTSNRSSHTMQYFYIAYCYSNIYGCRYVSKISFCLLSLPLEGEVTLKYRCVCRPCSEKFNIVSNNHGRTQKCDFCVSVCKTNFTDLIHT